MVNTEPIEPNLNGVFAKKYHRDRSKPRERMSLCTVI